VRRVRLRRCEAYAEAVVNDPEVKPSLCFPGKSEVAKEVAEITGKKMAAVEDVIAGVRCSRPEGKVPKKYAYIGYRTCTSANLAFGGPRSASTLASGSGTAQPPAL